MFLSSMHTAAWDDYKSMLFLCVIQLHQWTASFQRGCDTLVSFLFILSCRTLNFLHCFFFCSSPNLQSVFLIIVFLQKHNFSNSLYGSHPHFYIYFCQSVLLSTRTVSQYFHTYSEMSISEGNLSQPLLSFPLQLFQNLYQFSQQRFVVDV